MNAALPTGPLVQAIGWALLHLVWQGALVAGLLAVALAFFPGRSHLRYVLSCLALALIVALGVGTGIHSYRVSPPASGAIADAAVTTTLAAAPSVARPATSVVTLAPIPADRLQAFVGAANDALPRIVTFWLAGVLLFSGRLLLDWLRVRRLLRSDAPAAPEPWPSVARRLSDALGVRSIVRVIQSAAVEVPSVIGLMRPAILIPASTLAGLTPAQLEMILAHELAHVRRHDFLVNLLQAVVETLLFYHPAVWWVSRQIRTERENCCDDLAVVACGDRLRYARALLRLEELRAQRLALAMSADGGSLVERIRRIALGSTRASGSAVRAVGALAVPLAMVIAIALPSISAIRRTEGDRPPLTVPTDASQAEVAPIETAAEPATDPAPPSEAAPAPALVEIAADPATDVVATEPEADANAAADPEFADTTEDPTADEPIKPSIDELIELRAQHVTAEDVREMRGLFEKVSLRDIAGMKAVGASPAFIREMRRTGFPVKDAQEAQGLAALGITREFVREMRSVGFPVATAQEAQGLKATGVTAAYVRDMRARGLIVNAQEAQGMSALGVTAEYIEGLRKAGVDVSDADDVSSLRAIGITPAFIQRLADAGYKNLSAKDLTRLGAAGVTGDFIREMSRYRTR